MSEQSRCADAAALIGFLYDDCEPGERARISAHVAVCATCAEELESLSMTREQLSTWTPPDVRLGFRVSQAPPENVRAMAWWSRPLPAWAQLAAAVVIFALGTLVGMRSTSASAAPGDAYKAAAAAVDGRFEHLNTRLRELEARPQAGVAQVQLDPDTRNMLVSNMKKLIRESEDRTLRELAVRTMYMESNQAKFQEAVRQTNGVVRIPFGGFEKRDE